MGDIFIVTATSHPTVGEKLKWLWQRLASFSTVRASISYVNLHLKSNSSTLNGITMIIMLDSDSDGDILCSPTDLSQDIRSSGLTGEDPIAGVFIYIRCDYLEKLFVFNVRINK